MSITTSSPDAPVALRGCFFVEKEVMEMKTLDYARVNTRMDTTTKSVLLAFVDGMIGVFFIATVFYMGMGILYMVS